MDINIDKLKAELAVKHGIVIDKQDPLFATVFLNQEIFKQYYNAVETQLKKYETQFKQQCELNNIEFNETITAISTDQHEKFIRVLNELKSTQTNNNIKTISEDNEESSTKNYLYNFIAFLLGVLFTGVAFYLTRGI